MASAGRRGGLITNLPFLVLTSLFVPGLAVRYQPTWDSLDARPLPDWYDEAKFGIFIHWGVFSVPSYMSEWLWWEWQGVHDKKAVHFMQANYPPDFTYADFASQFTAEFFNATEWAQLFQKAGAKYIVFVSKHHEGFTNWPSKYSWNWNSNDVGPKRDLVGELANAIRNNTDIHFGVYHSMFEWFNPLYLQDQANNFTTQDFVNTKTMPELYELVNTYKPDVVWSDGAVKAPDQYWKAKELIAWLYNDSPVKDNVVINDRWGTGDSCHHGGFYTCKDRYNPGYLVPHKWENAMTIDSRSWGYRRNADIREILTIEQLLSQLITTVSTNGNLLMNVGPTSDGTISPIYQERLLQIGAWLEVNGEAIYRSRPWTYQNDTVAEGVWYTQNNRTQPAVIYASLLSWPRTNLTLAAPVPSANTTVTLVGYKGPAFQWLPHPTQGLQVVVPNIHLDDMPCQWAWVLKLTNILN
ncbi:hypothetical protein BsWGS_06761 [Bradybaena similaris]